jgi:tRNA A-37 threonylcarbamoyl transferase component Bud32
MSLKEILPLPAEPGSLLPADAVSPGPNTEPETSDPLEKILREALAGLPENAPAWRLSPATPWFRVSPTGQTGVSQGWKLHVSATVEAAPQALAQALPVLLKSSAPFKFAGSLEMLGSLNEGNGALSQVGKFITVYPQSEAQAVELAQALDAATAGLAGPKVPSDRQLRPGSLVFYRYGGFDGHTLQTPMGEILPALTGPDGELIPDRRVVPYQPPTWVQDPFEAAGVAQPLPAPPSMIAGKYYIIAKLYNSPRNTVYLGIDLADKRRCVLKLANAETGQEELARQRLAHEASVLQRLAPDPRFPAFYGLVEQSGGWYLAMEDVEGVTLEAHIQRLAAQGKLLPAGQVVGWARELARMLGAIHALHMVYRDLKTTNIIVTPDGHLRLLDFELAYDTASEAPPFGLGTRGYMSPQQIKRQTARPADDIYGLGVILYYLATGAEPSMAPNSARLLDRAIELLNPASPPALNRLIARCLAAEPEGRFDSMTALDQALAGCEEAGPGAALSALEGAAESESEEESRSRYARWAARLADTLCSTAQKAPGSQGVGWVSGHNGAMGWASRDLNTGSGGSTLALAELAASSGNSQQQAVLREAVEWLRGAGRPGGPPVPGLYVGEAGIATAILRAGLALDDASLIEEAARRGKWIATLPYNSPDLFNGTAGRLRFHLWLWQATGDPAQLETAVQAGGILVKSAETGPEGGVRWTFPSGYDGLSNHAYTGYAHGASGIADSLLDLYEATGENRFKDTALQTAVWLAGLARPTLADDSGLDWPQMEGSGPTGGLWCHGAAGTGLFFLHLDRLGLWAEARRLVRGAARMVGKGTRWANPVLCHGLAGQIEFLLDVYRAWGEREYLEDARVLGRLLETFAFEKEGLWYWPSESPEVVSADFMVGYGGIALTLLRLANPEKQPRALLWPVTRPA